MYGAWQCSTVGLVSLLNIKYWIFSHLAIKNIWSIQFLYNKICNLIYSQDFILTFEMYFIFALSLQQSATLLEHFYRHFYDHNKLQGLDPMIVNSLTGRDHGFRFQRAWNEISKLQIFVQRSRLNLKISPSLRSDILFRLQTWVSRGIPSRHNHQIWFAIKNINQDLRR